MPFSEAKIDKTLVLVTERKEREDPVPHFQSRDLDMLTPWQVDRLREVLEHVVEHVIEINDLNDFLIKVPDLKGHVVLPHWNGARSRNRTTHVSAICEAANVPYIGADTYVRIIANDKSLSKVFLDQAGIPYPKSVFVSLSGHAELIRGLKLPVIVKPNMEGSSIGIDQNSVQQTYEQAIAFTQDQLEHFPEGLIVEEYISGAEVSVLAVCRDSHITKWAVAERYIKEDETYLHTNVYDYSAKFDRKWTLALRPYAAPPGDFIERFEKLVKILGHVDYLRLDCRVDGQDFKAIEITPDPSLVPTSEFLGGFDVNGTPPAAIVSEIIRNSLSAWQYRKSNN